MPAAAPEHIKAEVLERIRGGESHGAIGRALNIPSSTVSTWAQRGGLGASPGSENLRAASDRANAAWQARKGDAIERASELAMQALDVCRGKLDDGNTKDAKDAITIFAIAVDKTAFLAGEATSRSESLSIVADAADVRALKERLART